VQCEEDHQWQLKERGENGRRLSQDSTFNLPRAMRKPAVRLNDQSCSSFETELGWHKRSLEERQVTAVLIENSLKSWRP